jgi:hypothetical protein
MTLPESTLAQLASIDTDRARAIVMVTEAALPNEQKRQKLIEIAEVMPGLGVIIVGPAALAQNQMAPPGAGVADALSTSYSFRYANRIPRIGCLGPTRKRSVARTQGTSSPDSVERLDPNTAAQGRPLQGGNAVHQYAPHQRSRSGGSKSLIATFELAPEFISKLICTRKLTKLFQFNIHKASSAGEIELHF